jgi:hypothetical protein
VRGGARCSWLGLLAAASLLLCCEARFESFPFEPAEGAPVEIRQSPGRPVSEETRFAPAAKIASPLYSLRKTQTISSGNLAFALSYTGAFSGVRLTILSDSKTALTAITLPSASQTRLRFLVPLGKGDRIWGYRLSGDPAGAPSGAIELFGAGIARFTRGFAIDSHVLTVDGSVAVLEASPGWMAARLVESTRQKMSRELWRITLTMSDPGGEPGAVRFEGPDRRSAAFSIDPSRGGTPLDFCRGSIGFLPRDVSADLPVRSLEISAIAQADPIPADPGMVLSWDRSFWREKRWELFSWERFPKVLIFDTSSYEVQDGLFKRLAFFVEKAGFTGAIPESKALGNRHGYNAHDYRADDLARFFSTAEREGVALTAEEHDLADILVASGIIAPRYSRGFQGHEDSAYAPGDGAVISISRSSPAALRELLLSHECFHGAFFSLPVYRDACREVWETLLPLEKEVWREFLASKGYDFQNYYLVVNEFQSYLLQQPRERVRGFQAVTLARLRPRSARTIGLVDRLLAERPDSFVRSFDLLDKALRAAGGPPGGKALAVRAAR